MINPFSAMRGLGGAALAQVGGQQAQRAGGIRPGLMRMAAPGGGEGNPTEALDPYAINMNSEMPVRPPAPQPPVPSPVGGRPGAPQPREPVGPIGPIGRPQLPQPGQPGQTPGGGRPQGPQPADFPRPPVGGPPQAPGSNPLGALTSSLMPGSTMGQAAQFTESGPVGRGVEGWQQQRTLMAGPPAAPTGGTPEEQKIANKAAQQDYQRFAIGGPPPDSPMADAKSDQDYQRYAAGHGQAGVQQGAQMSTQPPPGQGVAGLTSNLPGAAPPGAFGTPSGAPLGPNGAPNPGYLSQLAAQFAERAGAGATPDVSGLKANAQSLMGDAYKSNLDTARANAARRGISGGVSDGMEQRLMDNYAGGLVQTNNSLDSAAQQQGFQNQQSVAQLFGGLSQNLFGNQLQSRGLDIQNDLGQGQIGLQRQLGMGQQSLQEQQMKEQMRQFDLQFGRQGQQMGQAAGAAADAQRRWEADQAYRQQQDFLALLLGG